MGHGGTYLLLACIDGSKKGFRHHNSHSLPFGALTLSLSCLTPRPMFAAFGCLDQNLDIVYIYLNDDKMRVASSRSTCFCVEVSFSFILGEIMLGLRYGVKSG